MASRAVRILLVLCLFAGALLAAASGAQPALADDTASSTAHTFSNGPLADQTVLTDDQGQRIDAHDGHVYFFGDRYYWYGTSYSCGFDFHAVGTHFCGVEVYESADLSSWHNDGLALDPSTDQAKWDADCGGDSYGCFRPKVAYDAATKTYVMWVNESQGTDGQGYLVLTSSAPAGPFTVVAHRAMAINRCPIAIKAAIWGDEDLFVDHDGVAYLVYTAIYHTACGTTDAVPTSRHFLVVERLDPTYTAGTGQYTTFLRPHEGIESPSLFRRGNLYYLLYSDPSCPYCTSAGTAYATSTSPLGPFSWRANITPSPLGGQPMAVTPIAANGSTQYIYMLDRWNQVGNSTSITNQRNANYFFAPLSFTSDGRILPIPPVTGWQTRAQASAADTWLPPATPAGSSSAFQPLPQPVRLLDTRVSRGPLRPSQADVRLKLPASLSGAAGVVLDVTAVSPTGSGNLRVWGSGGAPNSSVINYSTARSVVSNAAIVRPDAQGYLHLHASTHSVQLVLDATGWVNPGRGLTVPTAMHRVVDTRTSHAVAPGASVTVRLSGVPVGSDSVALNVTTLADSAGSLVLSDPAIVGSGDDLPVAFGRGVSASMVLRAVPRTGTVKVTNSSARAVHVVLDLQAYSNASSVTVLDKPVVVSSTADGIGPYTQPLASGLTYQYSAADADVPPDAVAAIVQLGTGAGGSGYLSAAADQAGFAGTSDLNMATGLAQSNVALVRLSRGMFDLYVKSSRPVDSTVRILGYTT